MPVISAGSPTVSVTVPVPQPVQSKPKPPVNFGGEEDTAPQQPTGPTGVPPAPRPKRQLQGVIIPWSPEPDKKQMRRLPVKVIRYTRPENLDHAPFHRQILHDTNTSRGLGKYTAKDGTSSLVYADFLEENGMPEMAQFVRDAANKMMGASGGYSDPTAIMEYTHSMTPLPGSPLSLYVYQGNGIEQHRGRSRKRLPTLQISARSPHPDKPNASLAFNADLPKDQAEQLIRRLLAEGHPAGNNSPTLKRLAPPVENTGNDDTPPSSPQEKLSRKRLPVKVIKLK